MEAIHPPTHHAEVLLRRDLARPPPHRAELVTDDREALKERFEAATGERIAALETVAPDQGKVPEPARGPERGAVREPGSSASTGRESTPGTNPEPKRSL